MLGSVPKLLEQLEKFDENSASHKLYHNQINNYTSSFIEGQRKQIEQIRNQQGKMVDSNIALKESIANHINEIVENRVKQLEMSIEQSDEIKA